MALPIVRFRHQASVQWGCLESADRVRVLPTPCTTTRELLTQGHDAIARLVEASSEAVDRTEVELLSPITDDAKVLCQGANYREHMIDSGMDPDAKSFNLFFTKSSASITGPTGAIVKPRHVKLLDYEIELTLVMKKRTSTPVEVTQNNLHEYVAGICIGNDVSARDVQLPQMQFHKGKSYRTFSPLGPVLCLLEPSEMGYLGQMQLSLSVNGEVRQRDSTANLVFKPAETLSEYSQIVNFEPGDVLMTGTPSGCALSVPPRLLVKLSGLLPEPLKWKFFIKGQQRRRQYLQVGDRVEARIVSQDGRIDLGCQSHSIVAQD
ncbi:fumarylacetoacetate hydrolase family protein [Pseudomonas sp. NCHU5208]|uniref:fumarylacetoacetate hydrolase family protein n=1 Tax=unclassified Pseudomonas TaxID=196821 RepID=UPI003F9A756C